MGSPEPFQVAVFKDLMIPMRDGVRLATDIYRPARAGELLPGPFPALLVRTSYDKQAAVSYTHLTLPTKRIV